MTDAEINTAIAVACGTHDRWVIVKRGLYYRPDAHGYTSNVGEAWIVSEEIAEKHITHFPCDEPVTKRLAPLPDYANDLSAIREAVLSQTEAFQDDFDSGLKNSGEWIASMSARDWAEIFLASERKE